MAIDPINLAIFIAVSVVFALLVYLTTSFAVKVHKYKNQATQLKLDSILLMEKLESLMKSNEDITVEQTEGFLKFISESRDWAFEYIEKVQKAIEALRVAIDSDDPEADIETAYENVISFLPDKREG